jgi:hypothetical protein
VTTISGDHESCAPCHPTNAGCRLRLILLTGTLMVIPRVFSAYPLPAQTNGTVSAQKRFANQHFVCDVGYTKRECQIATAVLRNGVTRYPVYALNGWTWVLVRTADWKYILPSKGINVNDPAFSNLSKRVTFIDGSLIDRASIRGIELRMVWHMPVEELLDLTIRHELAHALCNEHDETRAERAAIALKNGTTLPCRVVAQASAANRDNLSDTR